MPHIHTQPGQHDLTASALIVRLDGPEPAVILHTHRKLGILFHFGGHVELDEDPWQAIVREVKEEAGYDIGQLKLLQPKSRLKKLDHGKLIPYPIAVLSVGYQNYDDKSHMHDDLCFAFVTDQAPSNSSADGESQDYRQLTREQLFNLSDSQVAGAIREMGLFIFDECLEKWEQVPAEEISHEKTSP